MLAPADCSVALSLSLDLLCSSIICWANCLISGSVAFCSASLLDSISNWSLIAAFWMKLVEPTSFTLPVAPVVVSVDLVPALPMLSEC
jgi:hypothetical protein